MAINVDLCGVVGTIIVWSQVNIKVKLESLSGGTNLKFTAL